MLDYKTCRIQLHKLGFSVGLRPPKLDMVNLSRRFYYYFGFSQNTTCLKVHGFYDYKTKTIFLDPKYATMKDLDHEFVHYQQHMKNPKAFIAWDNKMAKIAKQSCQKWLKMYYSDKNELNARKAQ